LTPLVPGSPVGLLEEFSSLSFRVATNLPSHGAKNPTKGPLGPQFFLSVCFFPVFLCFLFPSSLYEGYRVLTLCDHFMDWFIKSVPFNRALASSPKGVYPLDACTPSKDSTSSFLPPPLWRPVSLAPTIRSPVGLFAHWSNCGGLFLISILNRP